MGEKKIGERREPRISMRRGKDGGNVTVVYHRRVQEYFDILNASFLYLTGHKHIFCSSWSRGISENSRKEICNACSKSIFKIFPRILEAWYWKNAILSTGPRICQREDIWPIRANLVPRAFSLKKWEKAQGTQLQSEHDTRIWHHGTGTVALKACLQAPPPFPPPQSTARLASLAFIFPIWPRLIRTRHG